MAAILSLESSTTTCSVAMHDDKRLCASMELFLPQLTSSDLAPMIRSIVKSARISFQQIDAVAISSGPGSYTGLRIGMALAKGLCFSLGVPLISINTLQVMAEYVRSSGCNGFLCPMIDARRMEVYCLLLDDQNRLVINTSAIVVDELTFANELKNNTIYFFGNGAAKCETAIGHKNAKFLKGIVPIAAAMGELAFNKFENSQFENLVTCEPIYLKEFLIKKPKPKL